MNKDDRRKLEPGAGGPGGRPHSGTATAARHASGKLRKNRRGTYP